MIDEKKRITVPEIQEHPWYGRPLLPKYAAAEAQICARQRQVEEYIRRRDLNIVRAPRGTPPKCPSYSTLHGCMPHADERVQTPAKPLIACSSGAHCSVSRVHVRLWRKE